MNILLSIVLTIVAIIVLYLLLTVPTMDCNKPDEY